MSWSIPGPTRPAGVRLVVAHRARDQADEEDHLPGVSSPGVLPK